MASTWCLWQFLTACCIRPAVPTFAGKSSSRAVVVPEGYDHSFRQDRENVPIPKALLSVYRPESCDAGTQTDAWEPELPPSLPPPKEIQTTGSQCDPFLHVKLDHGAQKPLDLVVCVDLGGFNDPQGLQGGVSLGQGGLQRSMELLESMIHQLDMPPVQLGCVSIAGQSCQTLPPIGRKQAILEYVQTLRLEHSLKGTKMAPALGVVRDMFGQTRRNVKKAVVVITGADPVDVLEVCEQAKLLKSQGVPIVFVQVGNDAIGTAQYSNLASAQGDQVVVPVPTLDHVSGAVEKILEQVLEVSSCFKRAKFAMDMNLKSYSLVSNIDNIRGLEVVVPGWEMQGPDKWTWQPRWDNVLEGADALRWNISMMKPVEPGTLTDLPKLYRHDSMPGASAHNMQHHSSVSDEMTIGQQHSLQPNVPRSLCKSAGAIHEESRILPPLDSASTRCNPLTLLDPLQTLQPASLEPCAGFEDGIVLQRSRIGSPTCATSLEGTPSADRSRMVSGGSGSDFKAAPMAEESIRRKEDFEAGPIIEGRSMRVSPGSSLSPGEASAEQMDVSIVSPTWGTESLSVDPEHMNAALTLPPWENQSLSAGVLVDGQIDQHSMSSGFENSIELQAQPVAPWIRRVSLPPPMPAHFDACYGLSGPESERHKEVASRSVIPQGERSNEVACGISIPEDERIADANCGSSIAVEERALDARCESSLACGRHVPLDLCICVAQSCDDTAAFDRVKNFIERIARCTRTPEIRLALLRPALCGSGVEEACPLSASRSEFLRDLSALSDLSDGDSRMAPLLRMALTLLDSQRTPDGKSQNNQAVLLITNQDPSDVAATEAAARALVGASVRLIFVAIQGSTQGQINRLALKRLAGLAKAVDQGQTLFKSSGEDLPGLVPAVLKLLVVDGSPTNPDTDEIKRAKEDAQRELAEIRAIAEADMERLRQEIEHLRYKRVQTTPLESKISEVEEIHEVKRKAQAELDQIRAVTQAEMQKLKTTLEEVRSTGPDAEEVEETKRLRSCLQREEAEVQRISKELQVTGAYNFVMQDKLNESIAEARSLREELQDFQSRGQSLRGQVEEADSLNQHLRGRLAQTDVEAQLLRDRLKDVSHLEEALGTAQESMAAAQAEARQLRAVLQDAQQLRQALKVAEETMQQAITKTEKTENAFHESEKRQEVVLEEKRACERQAQGLQLVLEATSASHDAEKQRLQEALDNEETARIVAEENMRRLHNAALMNLPQPQASQCDADYSRTLAHRTARTRSPDSTAGLRTRSPSMERISTGTSQRDADYRRTLGLRTARKRSTDSRAGLRTRSPSIERISTRTHTRSPSHELSGRRINGPMQYKTFVRGHHEGHHEGWHTPYSEPYWEGMGTDTSVKAIAALLEAKFGDLRTAYAKFDDSRTRQLTLQKLIKVLAELSIDKHAAKILYYRLQNPNRGYLSMEDWLHGFQVSR